MSEENRNMQQQCSHDVVFGDAPIVGYFESNGRAIPVYCRGNLHEIILGMKLLTRRSPTLPATPTAQPADKPTE